MWPKKRAEHLHGAAESNGAARPPARLRPVIESLCAVSLAALFFCRFFGLSVGVAAAPFFYTVGNLLGAGTFGIPLILSLSALSKKGVLQKTLPRRISLLLFLLLLACLLARGEVGTLSEACREGRAFRGGGAIGHLLSLLFRHSRTKHVLIPLTLCLLFIGTGPFSPLRRSACPHKRRSAVSRILTKIRKGHTMFGKKKPIVIDDGGYYPVGSGEESFNQIRARLEKEEAAARGTAGDGTRVVYPEKHRIIPNISVEETTVQKEAPKQDIPLPQEKDPLTDIPAGTVVRASDFFGRGSVSSYTEPDTMPIFPPKVHTEVSPPPARDLPRVEEPLRRAQTVPDAAGASTAYVPPAAETKRAEIPESRAEEVFSGKNDFTVEEATAEAPIAAAISRAHEAETIPAAAQTEHLSAPQMGTAAGQAAPSPAKPYEKPPHHFPPLSLLKPSDGVGGSTDEEIQRNSESLLETLASFNVQATIRNVSRGPRITRYEIVPKRGVRIRNITNLQDDISMNLASAGIRIEAPIPGISAVGVEVPNRKSTPVRLRDMLDNEAFRSAASKTTVCVGSDVTGSPVYGDIAKMPHALIAGATGMGKSVCINSILLSLLYKARPDEVKLILVDPKKVELNVYNGIPHLLVPVVVEPQKAAGALIWAVGEMERRFNMIERACVRDLKGYNRIVEQNPDMGAPLPQIVIVIDELNDLMMSARDAVEDAICRIAQKARAAGIHLLIGTQRPSVDVITGVIKANIPSRIAFHVSSQVDSRTILDLAGAEKLLDKGDMLFFPVGVPKPIRVQGSLVDDDEVEAVTTYLKRNVDTSALYDDEVMANIEREAEKCTPKDKRAERSGEEGEAGASDDLFSDPQFIAAVEIAITSGQISTSKIQTKLRIGFQKASFYITNMEDMGIVGPLNGAKPREVLITMDQFLEMKARH